MDSDSLKEKSGSQVLIKKIIFTIALIVPVVLGAIIGTLSEFFTAFEAITCSLGSSFGAFISFIILKYLFPVRAEKNALAYIGGVLTIIVGIGAFVAWGTVSGDQMSQFSLIVYFLCGITWVVCIALTGMEPATLIALLLGALLGGGFYLGLLTLIPIVFSGIFNYSGFSTESLAMIRLVYGLLGAFAGGVGASAARASGLGIRDVFETEEL